MLNRILRINMCTLEEKVESVDEKYQLLGGRAFIAKFLLEEVKPDCEPLGHYNKLIFAPGLLGGSNVFSSGRISIGAKSPLTGGIKESNGGGVAGQKLGRLGYKAVVIEELPDDDRKYVVKITGSGIELLPGEEYWGLKVYEAAAKLRERFGNHVAVTCIGPAGEKKFYSAGIANTDYEGTPSRYSGRGGLGAVMGAKGIKALVIDDSGVKAQDPADPEALKKLVKDSAEIFKDSPVIESYKTYGTAAMVQVTNAVGGLPTRNFTTGKFEGADQISGERLYEVITNRKGKSTHNCMPGCLIGCSNQYKDEKGETLVTPLEYETIALMGSNLCIDNLDMIAKLNYLCNDYGLDTIETGAALGVAMEGGVIPFGDAEGAIKLVNEIGEGTLLGRVLGMGALIAGKVLGVQNVPVVKGQAMPGYEPRGFKGLGVTYATSPMGADHTAGSTSRAQIDHHSREGQAELSKKMQYTVPIYDDLGFCLFVSGAMGTHLDVLAQIVNAQLGTTFDEEDLFKLAENTVQWEREFNRRAGLTSTDDRLPEHFSETANKSTGTVFDVRDEELDLVHRVYKIES